LDVGSGGKVGMIQAIGRQGRIQRGGTLPRDSLDSQRPAWRAGQISTSPRSPRDSRRGGGRR
jgi:hypothetical protein